MSGSFCKQILRKFLQQHLFRQAFSYRPVSRYWRLLEQRPLRVGRIARNKPQVLVS